MRQKQRNFPQKTSVFWTLLISNLIPGVASAAILAVIFLPMMGKTARSTDDAYEQSMLYSARTQMNAVQETADNIRKQVENSEWLHPLYYDLLIGRKFTQGTNVQIMTDLQLLIAQNNNIEAIAFQLYDSPDSLFTNKGHVTNLEFYRENYPEKLQYHFLPCEKQVAQFRTNEFEGVTYLLYQTPIRDIPGGRYKGELNLFFRADEIGERLSQVTSHHAAAFRILSDEGEILWEYDTGLFQEPVFTLSVPLENDMVVLQMDAPERIHNRTTHAVFPLAVFTVILDFVLCVVLAIVLSKASYKPFKKIVQKIVGFISPQNNEFAALDRVFDQILLEKAETKTALNQLRPLARQKVLGDLLDGSAFLRDSPLKNCQIQFDYMRFNVIALEAPFSKREHLGQELDMTAELAIEILLKHLALDLPLTAYPYNSDSDHYRIIINYEDQDTLTEYARILFMQCRQFFQEDPVYLGIGQAVNAVEEIYRTADQAEIALHYVTLNRLECIVFYSDVLPQMNHEYYYPLSEEILLARAITTCNAESAKMVLSRIVQINREKTVRNPVTLQRLEQDLLSTVCRSGHDVGLSVNDWELYHRVPADLDDALTQVSRIVDQICDQFIQRQKEPSNSLESRILAYIDQNLYDPSLSLGSIAAHFGKSIAYISTVFKSSRGSNYNDYVNQARVIRAMELMRKERMDLNTAYLEVGYVSLSTFRRNFMKYAKTNPGDFLADCENSAEGKE